MNRNVLLGIALVAGCATGPAKEGEEYNVVDTRGKSASSHAYEKCQTSGLIVQPLRKTHFYNAQQTMVDRLYFQCVPPGTRIYYVPGV